MMSAPSTDVMVRAHARAQRRFHRMIVEASYADPTSRSARLYIQAERLIDRLRGEQDAYVLTDRALEARVDAAWDASCRELAEIEDAGDDSPWCLPDAPKADPAWAGLYVEGDQRADWGNR